MREVLDLGEIGRGNIGRGKSSALLLAKVGLGRGCGR